MAIDIVEGQFSPSTYSFTETYCGGTATKSAYANFEGVEILGYNTPNYKKRVAAGELLPATYWKKFSTKGTFSGSRSYIHVNSSCAQDCWYYQPKAHTNHWSFLPTDGGVAGTVSHSYSSLIDLLDYNQIDHVTTRALLNLRSSTHDSLTFLAEFGKVVTMFRDFGGNLVKFIKQPKRYIRSRYYNVHRSDFQGLDDLTSGYLQFRYGWRTLLYDAKSIEEALKELEEGIKFWEGRNGLRMNDTILESGSYQNVGVTIGCQTTHDIEISYRGIARGLQQPPRFGGNAVVTAWELVPLSFVFDWFTNVGQKLAMIGTSLGRTNEMVHYGIYVSKRSTSESSVWADGTGCPGYRMQTQGTAVVESELILRDKHWPTLIPTWRTNLDEFKVLDMVSLAYQALRRSPLRFFLSKKLANIKYTE